jgi:hypothetical protein
MPVTVGNTTFPPISSLDFAGELCNNTAEFLYAWLQSDPSVDTVIRYLIDALPAEMQSSTPSGDILQWYALIRIVNGTHWHDFHKYAIERPLHRCQQQLCSSWNWSENADLAGIGVSLSKVPTASPSDAYRSS